MCKCALAAAALVFLWSLAAAQSGDKPPAKSGVQKTPFGTTQDGQAVDLYTLTNANGMVVKIMTYGTIVTEILVPDRNGKLGDVVLGFDDLKGYLGEHPYFGATVGRYANRIAKGRFTLDGKEYKLAVNNGPNALHGGLKGFDKVVWRYSLVKFGQGNDVAFDYVSKDGEEGYPGTLRASVFFRLTDQNELYIDYIASADKPTPVNLTNHSYFNLAGPASGDVLSHELMLAADQCTPVDDTLIPTGEIAPVKGTPLDFTTPTAIGARIKQLKGNPAGYDHNFVLRAPTGTEKLRLAARVKDPKTGRTMEMLTTEPGVQFYSGNFLDGKVKGKGGIAYQQHQGFCLEAQHFPDSVNKPNFPSVILRPGETYKQTTVYRFGVEK